MKRFTTLSSITMPLDRANIDTDAIIPKPFGTLDTIAAPEASPKYIESPSVTEKAKVSLHPIESMISKL